MANEVSFKDYFAGQRMTRIANADLIKVGIGEFAAPAEFLTPGPTKPYDDEVQYNTVTWNRGGATVVQRGSPARAINVGQRQWAFSTLLNMGEEMGIDVKLMSALSSNIPMIKANAEDFLTAQMGEFIERFDTTRKNMVYSMLRNGASWVTSGGQISTASTNAVLTLGTAYAAAQQLTKDGTGGTYNIGDWSDPATDISANLRSLQNKSVQQTNWPVYNVLYGSAVPSYLIKNKTVAPYFARNPQFNPNFTTNNEVPQGTLGFNWKPVRLAYNVQQDVAQNGHSAETVAAWFPDDFLFIYPNMNPGWYEFIEGGTLIPKGIYGPGQTTGDTSLQSMFDSYYQIGYGKVAYGKVEENGPKLVMRDCAGSLIKNYSAVFAGRCATSTA